MERKFRVTEIGKFEYTLREVVLLLWKFRKMMLQLSLTIFEWKAPHFTTAGCVLFCV